MPFGVVRIGVFSSKSVPQRYTHAMPIHPEGEDQSTEENEIVRCPHCRAPVPVPRFAAVDEFACPQCGERIPVHHPAQ